MKENKFITSEELVRKVGEDKAILVAGYAKCGKSMIIRELIKNDENHIIVLDTLGEIVTRADNEEVIVLKRPSKDTKSKDIVEDTKSKVYAAMGNTDKDITIAVDTVYKLIRKDFIEFLAELLKNKRVKRLVVAEQLAILDASSTLIETMEKLGTDKIIVATTGSKLREVVKGIKEETLSTKRQKMPSKVRALIDTKECTLNIVSFED